MKGNRRREEEERGWKMRERRGTRGQRQEEGGREGEEGRGHHFSSLIHEDEISLVPFVL